MLATGLGASIPVINSTVKAVRAGWVPAGDDGIIATRGWDVLTSHTPLVGQYSEAGLVVHGQVMHSPGPMLYWLLAIPARFGTVSSLAVAMCIANCLCIIGCVALARRRGGYVLMLACGAGIALMCQSLPTESLHDIWNPAAGLFPFLLLLFSGWSLACGDYRLLPLVALLASFVTQTHLMYLAPTVVVLGIALPALVVQRARARALAAPRRIWPWALAALVVLCACWTPPAINQLRENPGNLTMVARTVEHRGATLGSSVGWHAVVRSIGERPWWLYVPASEWERKRDVLHAPSASSEQWAVAVLAALVVVLIAGAWRRRFDLSLAALIALGLCGAMFAQVSSNPASTLLAETLGYTLWWGSELGFFVWLVLVWAAWLAIVGCVRMLLARRVAATAEATATAGATAAATAEATATATASGRGRAWRQVAVIAGCAAGAVGVAAIGNAVAATAKPDSHVYEYAPVHAMARGIERLVPSGVSIDWRLGPLDRGTQPMEPALRFMLVRHDDRVLAPGSFARLGTYYELYHRPYQWIVYIGDGRRAVRHMTLAARVRFHDQWGAELLSAWVRHVPAGAQRAGAEGALPARRVGA